MSDDLGVAESSVSWALTLRLLAAGFTGPILGGMIDRHGARWIGAVAGMVAGGSFIALAAAPSIWVVLVLFAISGLAGIGGPGGQLLTQVPLAKWFVRSRGRALAIATAGFGGGTVVAIPVTQWLISSTGWRETSLIYGLLVVVTVVPISLLFVKRAPEDIGLFPDGASEPPTAATMASISRVATSDEYTLREALHTRAMWMVLASLAVAGMAITGTVVHRVHFWEETGMSPGLVAFGTAMDPLVLFFSIFVFGFLADRVPVRYLGCAGLLGFALSTIPMIITSGEAYTVIVNGAVFGAAAGGFMTLNNLVWPNYFGRQSLGAIRGLALPVSIAASGIGAPLYGYLLGGWLDPSAVWALTLGAFTLSALLILVARPPRKAATTVRRSSAYAGSGAGGN